MNEIHRQVLANKTKEIVETLSQPRDMADVSLRTLLSESDRQAISRETDRHGTLRASQLLVSTLEKRGLKAFSMFVDALRSETHKHWELADELEREVERLGGNIVRSAEQRGPPQAPKQFVPRGVTHHRDVVPPQSEHRQETSGLDMLLKDIPSNIHRTIVNLLDADDPLGKNWLAVAGRMKMSVTDTNTLKQNGKMEGLFREMTNLHMRLKDLVQCLIHEDVNRKDVIEELKKANLITDEELKELLPKESSETDSSEVVTASHSTSEQAQPERALMSPAVRCQETFKLDDTVRQPVQPESSDQHGVDESMNSASPTSSAGAARLPTSQEETNPTSQGSPNNRPVAQESVDDTDGGPGATSITDMKITDDAPEGDIERKALIIGCVEYDERLGNLNSQLKKKIKELYHTLGLARWEAKKPKTDRKHTCSAPLKEKIKKFIDSSIDDKICLLYLAGHTVHINGVNYLLPTDVDPEMTRADLVECCVDVDNLLETLSRSKLSVVFLDGAHECTTEFRCRSALKGLAPVSPRPNIMVAYAARPGITRPAAERLHYIESLIRRLPDKDIALEDTFTRIRKDMQTRSSPPVEYSVACSALPFCLNPSEGLGLRVPDSNASRHAVIVKTSPTARETDLETALRQILAWNLETPRGDKAALRTTIMNLSRIPGMKIVMVYFIGRAHEENGVNYLELNESVRVQWVLDLMCELIKGPKVLVVDDPESNGGFAPMIAPPDCLLSLPDVQSSDGSDNMYTRHLSQIIGANPAGTRIGALLERASRHGHVIYKNLFFA